ncbi:unnamed protein product [Rhizophagus irregularis]|nr:unnamed protein product [Rhizophagus irregularis]
METQESTMKTQESIMETQESTMKTQESIMETQESTMETQESTLGNSLKTKLVKFICETKRKMSELGVNSLNIIESNATLESNDIGTLKVFFGKHNDEDEDILEDASPLKLVTTTIKNISDLS